MDDNRSDNDKLEGAYLNDAGDGVFFKFVDDEDNACVEYSEDPDDVEWCKKNFPEDDE